jgi:hypothetical protein
MSIEKKHFYTLCVGLSVYVRSLQYISRVGLPILLQEICGPILEYIKIARRHMNVVGTEAAQLARSNT